MKNLFSTNTRHIITEANINFYATPFTHPRRTMKEYDFIYLIQGDWKIGQNDEIYELKKDTVLVLAGDVEHYGAGPCCANTKTMYFHALCNEVDEGDSFFIESLTDASLNKNIKKVFSEIVNAKLSGNQRKADIYFKLLLCELYENSQLSAGEEIAIQIKNIIHKNPEKFFNNTYFADKLNVSVKTVQNKFFAAFGITIHRYMLNFKIEEAISYFSKFPDMSIKEISYNLGFYDEYHFSRQFKKIKGISPRLYKNQLENMDE